MTNLDNTTPPANPGDVLLLRVILAVTVIGVMCVVAIATLEWRNADHPGILDNLATGALVGLTGLLAARRT